MQIDRTGQVLGNYRLVKLLGRGGYAEVYLAENKYLGIQTAIKVLKLRDLDTVEQEQFRSEASFMTTLEHLRIIKVLDYGIEMSQRGSGNDRSTPYLVMEYAPLGTLRHLYPYGTQMPLPTILSYTKQIAEALQYAHDKDIIHRDVKPENMLVRKVDDTALSDFGIAVVGLNTSNIRLQEEGILEKIARGEQVAIPGTPPYLAPERLLGHSQRASDQYSLAVVVYEWLSGSRPFDGTELEICQKHATEPPPSLSQRFPHISREVEQVVMRALSKMPGDRYKSVWEFALALEATIQRYGAKTTKIFPAQPFIVQPGLPQLFDDHPDTQKASPNGQVEIEFQQDDRLVQNIPWWKEENPPFTLDDPTTEVHPEKQPQSKGEVSSSFKQLLQGISKLFMRQKKQDTIAPISLTPLLSAAPSTVLFPASIPNSKELKDFFISHCKADDTWASWIAWELEDAGYSIILPSWDFRAGSDLERQMQKAAAKARCSIVVLSPDYFNARTTQIVRNILLGKDTVNGKYTLLPVLIREGSPELRTLSEQVKCIDLLGLDEIEARIKLLTEVRGERFKPIKRPVYPGNTSEKPPFPNKQLPETGIQVDSLSTTPVNSIEIFFSYSRYDEALRKELDIHLSPLKRRYSFKGWYDRSIDAGSEFAKEIDSHLKTAHIILLLVTPNFIASDYCYDIEMAEALKRHESKDAFVVPIILRPTSWRGMPFGKLQALPNDGRPVTSSSNSDAAFVEVAEGIEALISRLIKGMR